MIYPPQKRCLNCGQKITRIEIRGICADCLAKVDFVVNYCHKCGREIEASLCGDCRKKLPAFEQARSVAVYQGIIRDFILQFKYYGNTDLSRPLSHFLMLYFYEYYGDLSIDYIIPVPLHGKRQKMRGYNQAELLARELKREMGIPVLTDYLLRVKNTRPLYNLNQKERQQALDGVFALREESVDTDEIAGSNILLLDDIFTTGTTVNEASLLLNEEGRVEHIYVLTLATATLDENGMN